VEPFVFADLARKALRTCGAVGQGVSMSAADLDLAFMAANDMIDAWAAQRLTIFQVLLKTFPLVANQGSPTNPYTVGIGGDFNIARPTFINGATMQVLTTNPPFKISLTPLEDDEYANLTIPNLGSALSESFYYNGKFDTSGVSAGLGEFFLFPVPNGQQPVELVLQIPTAMGGFADKTTTLYQFPQGYAEALRYQLAKRLAIEFGKTLSPENQQLAIDTFAVIQRPNASIPSLRCDFGVPGAGATNGLYNWRVGANTGRRGFY
jgi:hypothetical protein